MTKKTVNLNEKAKELVDLAMQAGVEQNFFFMTTLDRYNVQLKTLADLKKVLESENVLVTKEYVKGRRNLYTHPAITEYNKTSQAANNTVQTLLKIITTLAEHSISDNIESEDDEL